MNTASLPRLGRVLFVALALSTCTLLTQAQSKLAVINLKTAFDGYWKTKQADAQLKERANSFDQTRKGMIDDYQKANDDYKKLIDSANDQATSAEERDRRKKNAETKLLEIKEIEQSIRQFDQTSRTNLGEQQRRMRDNILREIRELIATKARAGSYNLILDTAAESVNQTPIVVFASGVPDLTDEILTQLNANAPPGALDAPKPEAAPADKK